MQAKEGSGAFTSSALLSDPDECSDADRVVAVLRNLPGLMPRKRKGRYSIIMNLDFGIDVVCVCSVLLEFRAREKSKSTRANLSEGLSGLAIMSWMTTSFGHSILCFHFSVPPVVFPY